MLKAYKCSDSEIYAAESLQQAAVIYKDHCGGDPDDGYPEELTDEQLDHKYPAFDEDERPIEGETTSIRQMLSEHGDQPGWLAGSEW